MLCSQKNEKKRFCVKNARETDKSWQFLNGKQQPDDDHIFWCFSEKLKVMLAVLFKIVLLLLYTNY